MPEVEFTLPTAQYANVKVRATPEELGLHGVDDAYELGVAAAVYLNLFQQGFKTGSQMDVSGPVSAPQEALGVGVPGAAEQRVESDLKPRTVDEANDMAAAVIKQELGATEIVAHEATSAPVGGVRGLDEVRAQALLDEGLGGVTEVPAGDIVAHEGTATTAPWVEVVDAKPKPWEAEATAPKAVVTEGW